MYSQKMATYVDKEDKKDIGVDVFLEQLRYGIIYLCIENVYALVLWGKSLLIAHLGSINRVHNGFSTHRNLIKLSITSLKESYSFFSEKALSDAVRNHCVPD